jgi:hypothetical protein
VRAGSELSCSSQDIPEGAEGRIRSHTSRSRKASNLPSEVTLEPWNSSLRQQSEATRRVARVLHPPDCPRLNPPAPANTLDQRPSSGSRFTRQRARLVNAGLVERWTGERSEPARSEATRRGDRVNRSHRVPRQRRACLSRSSVGLAPLGRRFAGSLVQLEISTHNLPGVRMGTVHPFGMNCRFTLSG